MKMIKALGFSLLLLSTEQALAGETAVHSIDYQQWGFAHIDVNTGETKFLDFVPGTVSSELKITTESTSSTHRYDNALIDYVDRSDPSFTVNAAGVFQTGGANNLYFSVFRNIPVTSDSLTEVTFSFTGTLDYDLSSSAGLKFTWFREGQSEIYAENDYSYIKYTIHNGDPENAFTEEYIGTNYQGNPDFWTLPTAEVSPDRVWVPTSGSNQVTYQITFGLVNTVAVPEPNTYVLLTLGLGLIGFVARGRKRFLI